jgi:hypothetical protein
MSQFLCVFRTIEVLCLTVYTAQVIKNTTEWAIKYIERYEGYSLVNVTGGMRRSEMSLLRLEGLKPS